MARQQARRRRRERAVGVVIVLLGAAVLIVAIVALREPKGHVTVGSTGRTVVETLTPTPTQTSGSGSSTTPRTASTSRTTSGATSSSASTPAAGVKSVPLVVLNNSGTGGLARGAAQRFQSGGWTVSNVDNLPNQTIISTCAYYDPSIANAKAAAEALQQQFPTIKRVKEKFTGLPSGPVVVVLTSDYSSG